jgi:hypothetical protein
MATETTSLSPQAKLEAVRQKCVEANPEIARGEWDHDIDRWIARDIRLADVLQAYEQDFPKDYSWHSEDDVLARIVTHYDLRSDSLDAQSPETIDFLHSLLCND